MIKTTVHYVKPLSVALLTALSITFSGSVFAVAGKFQFVNGEVQVIDTAGKSRLAQKGGAIDEGETVSSSGNGFAQIKMEDGGFFAVRPDTQFKVDTFQFNGKEDGSEKGVFSLIKGSLRSVTGLIGKKHKDNYKIQTATSTIGIRGSGADVGHNDAIGTAVRTLFGGHSLTSGGKTIVTGPGQTALAPPGQEPRFVPNFPFNSGTGAGGQGQGGNNAPNGGGSEQQKEPEKTADTNSPRPVAEQTPIIPIKDTSGNNFTTNTDSSGSTIGGDTIPGTLAPIGSGGSAVRLVSYVSNGVTSPPYGQNYFDVTDQQHFSAYLDTDGNVVGWKSTFSDPMYTNTTIFKLGAATLVRDGVDAGEGVVWGRWSSGYTASSTSTYNGQTSTDTIQPIGGLLFITAAHITTLGELGNYASWTPGPGLAMGGVSGTYVLAPGSFPTAVNGVMGGSITSASASVDFTSLQITSFNVAGNGGAFGSWSASSTGTASIYGANGAAGGFNVQLSGGCSGGTGSCASPNTIMGSAVGGFVGAQAQGMISTVGLIANGGGEALGGAVYMKRGALP